MNTDKVPLSSVIKNLHEKLQHDLKMYRYAGTQESIVHQVAENADAVEKVLSKPKRKKRLDEKMSKDRSPNANVFNLKDDGTSQGDIMNSTQFVEEIIELVNKGIITFPNMKQPNLVKSDLLDQISALEDRSEFQPFKISRSKITKKTDELLIVKDGSLKFNEMIFNPESGILVIEDETTQQPTKTTKPKSPTLFDVRHKEATATAPTQSTLTPTGR